jgi:hypothetical protein
VEVKKERRLGLLLAPHLSMPEAILRAARVVEGRILEAELEIEEEEGAVESTSPGLPFSPQKAPNSP